MKKEFDWGKFRNHDLVVICETLDESKDFITQYYERDMKWTNEKFHTNYEKVYNDIGYTYNGTLGYSDGDFYRDDSYWNNIVYWKDYMQQKEQTRKEMLKNDETLIVEIGRGDRYMLLGDKLCGLNGWMNLDSFDDDLKYINTTNIQGVEMWNINKIYRTYTPTLNNRFDDKFLGLIWERKEKEKVKMTKAEIEAELGYEIEIVETK